MANGSPTSNNPMPNDPQVEKLRLELENLKRINEKLSIELRDLRSESVFIRRFKNYLPLVTGLIGVAGFWFGIVQYFSAQAAAQEQQVKANEIFRLDLKRETAKPLWDKQLNLYIEAAEKAATIATTTDDKIRAQAAARFWVLYWGPLAAVEDVGLEKQEKGKIEEMMVKFGTALTDDPNCKNPKNLKTASLNLAHAIRDAIAPAFDVKVTETGNLRNPLGN